MDSCKYSMCKLIEVVNSDIWHRVLLSKKCVEMPINCIFQEHKHINNNTISYILSYTEVMYQYFCK